MTQATWTREETMERRNVWNAAVKGGEVTGRNGSVDPAKLRALQFRLGFTFDEMRCHADHYDLDGKRAAALATPEGQLAERRRERERIVDRIAVIMDNAEVTFERLHARQDPRAWTERSRIEVEAEPVRAELRTFDAAHPEALVAIRADREARHAESFIGRGLD